MRRPQALAIIALALSIDCHARICSPSKTEKDEGLQYLTNLIQSFGWAKEGLVNIPGSAANSQNLEELVQYATDFMLGLKRSSENYASAATPVEPHAKTK